MTRTASRLPDLPWYHDVHADREWMRHAACRNHDPELWFPRHTPDRRTRRDITENTRLAQCICLQCPVQTDCLRHALITDTRDGIWGGATAADRAQLTGRRVYG